MSHGLPLALLISTLLIGAISFSAGALASDDAAPLCADVSAPKAVVAGRHGTWTELSDAQWEFLRGVYVMNPETPPGLPYGDHTALARFDGSAGGIVFIDDKQACTPILAPAELASAIDEVTTHTI